MEKDNTVLLDIFLMHPNTQIKNTLFISECFLFAKNINKRTLNQ